jgi:hypothetical protein
MVRWRCPVCHVEVQTLAGVRGAPTCTHQSDRIPPFADVRRKRPAMMVKVEPVKGLKL